MSERVRMLFCVTARGKGKTVISELGKRGIRFSLQMRGHGTASSEMMDILGLDSADKDVVVSFGSDSAVTALAADLSSEVRASFAVRGMLVIFSPTAINKLVERMASYGNDTTEEKTMAKSDYDYCLILAAVNAGYTDSVMQAAKAAGATGGTVIRARLADTERIEQTFGVAVHGEKEILTIMTSVTSRDAIMDAINAQFGFTTKAQGIICSLPADRVYKL